MKKLLILLFVTVGLFAKININTASISELAAIKGIGAKKAALIVKYRKTHKFKTIKDIVNVKGIGNKIFNQIKNEISVTGTKKIKKISNLKKTKKAVKFRKAKTGKKLRNIKKRKK